MVFFNIWLFPSKGQTWSPDSYPKFVSNKNWNFAQMFQFQAYSNPEVGKVTLKSNGDEALNVEFLFI
jgi:hypothetical protein